jgi:cellulose synthase/poly-beta-1,6-N-acetylglucosamine synthase-like glycosyltransferase
VSGAEPAWWVGVVVPAQNEEMTIARCIESVIASHRACGGRTRLWMVVVADTCSDETVARARRALGDHGEVLECAPGSPGTARRLGVAAVMEHFRDVAPGRVWLANTDADTHVPVDWLQHHLDHADDDASAVAGIVQLDTGGVPLEVIRTYDETYRLNGDGTHAHVHGANLGVRADAYLDVGGWSHLAVAEDHCLWHRLKLRGWRLRSCVNSVVVTSARLHGRAVGGFADTLRRRVEHEHG